MNIEEKIEKIAKGKFGDKFDVKYLEHGVVKEVLSFGKVIVNYDSYPEDQNCLLVYNYGLKETGSVLKYCVNDVKVGSEIGLFLYKHKKNERNDIGMIVVK